MELKSDPKSLLPDFWDGIAVTLHWSRDPDAWSEDVSSRLAPPIVWSDCTLGLDGYATNDGELVFSFSLHNSSRGRVLLWRTNVPTGRFNYTGESHVYTTPEMEITYLASRKRRVGTIQIRCVLLCTYSIPVLSGGVSVINGTRISHTLNDAMIRLMALCDYQTVYDPIPIEVDTSPFEPLDLIVSSDRVNTVSVYDFSTCPPTRRVHVIRRGVDQFKRKHETRKGLLRRDVLDTRPISHRWILIEKLKIIEG